MSRPADRPGLGRRLGRALTAPFRVLTALWRQPRRTGLALASAAMIVLAFPPYEVYPLIFVAWIPLLFAIEGLRPRAAFGWGLLAGFAITAAGFYFMIEMLSIFGGMGAPFATFLHFLFSLYQGLGIALFAALTAWIRGRRRWPTALVVPATYVASESAARAIYIFPWYLANAAWPFTAFVQAADLLGGLGLTALVALVNATLYELARALRSRRAQGAAFALPRRALLVTAVLLVADIAYGLVRIPQIDAVAAESPNLRIGLVEADIGPLDKRDPELAMNNMLIHQELSARLAARGVDLIVWPETAALAAGYTLSTAPTDDLEELERTSDLVSQVPRDVTYFRPSHAPLVADYREDRRAGTRLRDVLAIQRGFHTPLLFGVLTSRDPTEEEAAAMPPHPHRPPRVYYNTAVLIDGQGRVLGTYDKSVLLVLGEYVPLSGFLWEHFGINFYEAFPTAGNVTPGESVSVMDLPVQRPDGTLFTARIGAMICYEDIITSYGLDLAELHPNLFINIINDGWFLQTSAAYHHMAFSILRTIEHRIPLVRATNTGVSAYIDPVGRLVQHTEVTGVETLVADVPVMPPPSTLFSKVGEVLGPLAWLGVLALAFVRRRDVPAA